MLRSLLSVNHTLAGDAPHHSFNLRAVLHDQVPIRIRGTLASDLLFLHVITSAWLEGFFDPYTLVCLYPGHQPGTHNALLGSFMKLASTALGGRFKTDLLERRVLARDTSAARAARVPVGFLDQAHSVALGAAYQDKLAGKTVVVLDDFTTQGTSLDWARQLLLEGGAARVVLIAVGKYGYSPVSHTVSTPRTALSLNPFQVQHLSSTDVREQKLPGQHHPDRVERVKRSLEALSRGDAYPL